MARKSNRSAGAKARENRKHGIVMPREAAELTSDPTYIDSLHNTFDNAPIRSFTTPRLLGLPYVTSDGPNSFVSHAPMSSQLFSFTSRMPVIFLIVPDEPRVIPVQNEPQAMERDQKVRDKTL